MECLANHSLFYQKGLKMKKLMKSNKPNLAARNIIVVNSKGGRACFYADDIKRMRTIYEYLEVTMNDGAVLLIAYENWKKAIKAHDIFFEQIVGK